jgi:HK97 gp10 family phage protein
MASEIDITVKIDIEDVKRALRELPREIAQKAVRGALMDGAEVVRAAARAMAPKRGFWPPKRAKGRAVPPGRLRKAIVKRWQPRPRIGDAAASVAIGRGAFYWHMVEFGHRIVIGRRGRRRVVGTVPPHPFLRPAFAAKGQEAVRRVLQRLGPRIEAIARGLRRRVAKRGL